MAKGETPAGRGSSTIILRGEGASSPAASRDSPRTVRDLERAVRAAEPAVCFVLPRVLRRVIKQHAELPGLGLRVPHRKCYVVERGPLLEIVDRDELGLDADEPLPDRVILLPGLNEDVLARMTVGEVQVWHWRLLFHARVHLAMLQRAAAGELSSAAVHRRLQQIGRTEFDEIRLVLGQEGFLLPPRDDQSVYVEFAAVYLELRYFAASLLPHYFPGIRGTEPIDAILAQDLDAPALFLATRPPGAPNPKESHAAVASEGEEPEPEGAGTPGAVAVGLPLEETYRRWVRRAEEAASRGNAVGSAIYRARAERWVPPHLADQARAAMNTDVDRLIRRLLAALGSPDRDLRPWQKPLRALVLRTPRGIWTAEARLLYDLQKVCVDHERDIYTVDLAEWALSLGRRPVKRALPNQRNVLIAKHLHSAARRLAAVRLTAGQRQQLSALLRTATKRAEERVRSRLRPPLIQALDEVGLVAQNLPARVARRKLVEELLDRVVDRGFLTVGDLRDAVSRNHLKLADCTRPEHFLKGDQLLQADKRLSLLLDGVYSRAEIYLRWMLRLSSWAFGTRSGRFLTRNLGVPFGGAYLVVAGMEHLMGLFSRHAELPFRLRLIQVCLLGLFLLGLIHSALFRRGVRRLFKRTLSAMHGAVARSIAWLTHLPLVMWLARSRLFKLGVRLVLKPLAFTTVAWFALFPEQIDWRGSAANAAAVFLAINLLLNSRLGRNLEEVVADWLAQAWQRFGLRLLTGLFWLVMDVFKGILQAVERMLYAVDEWLRFRSGESRAWLAGKAILGLVWFCLTYVIRFCVNLLIEPQINPIKHFPVVTVSHKLLLPFIPTLAMVLVSVSVEKHLAVTLATAIITAIPGVIGFFVWELKENWRLYEANRPRGLPPVPVGDHGETMARLLKPGFHSGTLPKRYAKLRRAERKALAKKDWRTVRKRQQALEHVQDAIRRFVDRDLLALLAESRFWNASPLTVGRVLTSPNQVIVTLERPDVGPPLEIGLAAESGWLLGRVMCPSWVSRMPVAEQTVLRTAILGFYKSAGVEIVRQQVDAHFPPPMGWAIEQSGFVVWPNATSNDQVRYDLRTDNSSLAQPTLDGSLPLPMPTLDRSLVVFAEVQADWAQWVEAWQQDQLGQGPPGGFLAGVPVLPESTTTPAA